MDTNSLTRISTAGFLAEFMGIIFPLRWMFLLALILTLSDLRFGLLAAKARGEPIRRSRAFRRTLNKMADYVSWIGVSFLFGQAFVSLSIPLLPILLLVIIYGIELNSCFANYFEYKGIKKKFDVFSIIKKKVDITNLEEKEK